MKAKKVLMVLIYTALFAAMTAAALFRVVKSCRRLFP